MKNKKWSIQISKPAAEKLKKFCKKHGYTMSGLVECLLEECYEQRKVFPIADKELDEINEELDKEWLKEHAT